MNVTYDLGGAGLRNRVLAVTYYVQRASAGLIVTEATQVSPQGAGYIRTPGIHSAAQVAGWKPSPTRFTPPAVRSFSSSGTSGASRIPISTMARCRSRVPPSLRRGSRTRQTACRRW